MSAREVRPSETHCYGKQDHRLRMKNQVLSTEDEEQEINEGGQEVGDLTSAFQAFIPQDNPKSPWRTAVLLR